MANVTIYSTPTCTFCNAAKEYFTEKNVDYTEIDVAADPTKAQEMVQKTGQMGVPVIIIEKDGNEEVIVGFDKQKINETLGLA